MTEALFGSPVGMPIIMFLRWFDVPGSIVMAAWKPWRSKPFFLLGTAGEGMLG